MILINGYTFYELSTFLGFYYLTMITYMFLILNLFFILFNVSSLRIGSLELLRYITLDKFYTFSFLLTVLSLGGVPPLAGFTVKLLQFIFFIDKVYYPALLLLIMYNVLSMYFYFNNFKYIISRKKDFSEIRNRSFLKRNPKFHRIIILINFLNIFIIF